jgi:hypothetical protein
MIRTGTAVALASKICLTAAIGIGLTQRTWRTLRRKFFQLESVDALFAISINPIKFFHREILLKAKLAVLLALLIWYVHIYSTK